MRKGKIEIKQREFKSGDIVDIIGYGLVLLNSDMTAGVSFINLSGSLSFDENKVLKNVEVPVEDLTYIINEKYMKKVKEPEYTKKPERFWRKNIRPLIILVMGYMF